MAPSTEHFLVVRAAGDLWALRMESVETTLDLTGVGIRSAGEANVLAFRESVLEVHDLSQLTLGVASSARCGVVLWAGGRRRIFTVDELVGPMPLERHELPAFVCSRRSCGAVFIRDEIVPVVEPGALVGAWSDGDAGMGLSDMQRSALFEIANIGSGHAATALSQLLGKPVEISYAEALVATLAEAADRIGAAALQTALVETPLAERKGKVLLLFPDGAAAQLCQLLGASIDEELGMSALLEVGNILASSYLNAIVQMTGLSLEPEPPTVEIDVLGSLVEKSLTGAASPDDPTVLMRSCMTIESSDAKFAFLFVPRLDAIATLLDALGVGTELAA
jgi:chemotaxis protein CheC